MLNDQLRGVVFEKPVLCETYTFEITEEYPGTEGKPLFVNFPITFPAHSVRWRKAGEVYHLEVDESLLARYDEKATKLGVPVFIYPRFEEEKCQSTQLNGRVTASM